MTIILDDHIRWDGIPEILYTNVRRQRDKTSPNILITYNKSPRYSTYTQSSPMLVDGFRSIINQSYSER